MSFEAANRARKHQRVADGSTATAELPSERRRRVASGIGLNTARRAGRDVGKFTRGVQDALEMRYVAVGRVVPLSKNPRRLRRDADFAELVASIRSVGVLQPLVCRPMPAAALRDATAHVGVGLEQAELAEALRSGELLELRAGHRRLAAAIEAGLSDVPVVVRAMDDREAAIVTAVENKDRKDLTPLEQGASVQLLRDAGLSLAEVADKLGVTPTWAARRAQLGQLTAHWRKAAEDEKSLVSRWTAPMLEEIARLPAEVQDAAWQSTAKNRWVLDRLESPRDVEGWVAEEFTHVLSKAPFSVKDVSLVPEAESCTLCPKRSGMQPELWGHPAAEEGAIHKDERCLDAGCFKRKVEAARRQNFDRARAKHGDGLLMLGNDYDPGHKAQAQAAGVKLVDRWKVSPAKKADPGAKPAYDVTTGAVKYVKTTLDKAGGAAEKPTRSAAATRELRAKREAIRRVLEILDQATEADPRKVGVLPGIGRFNLEQAARLAVWWGLPRVHELPDKWNTDQVLETHDNPTAALLLVQGALHNMALDLRTFSLDAAAQSWPECERIAALLEIDLAAILAEEREKAGCQEQVGSGKSEVGSKQAKGKRKRH